MFLMGVKKVSEAYFGYRISYERGSATVLKKLEDSRWGYVNDLAEHTFNLENNKNSDKEPIRFYITRI